DGLHQSGLTKLVVAGLVPAIHAFAAKTWMPGTRPGMTIKMTIRKGVDDGQEGSGYGKAPLHQAQRARQCCDRRQRFRLAGGLTVSLRPRIARVRAARPQD